MNEDLLDRIQGLLAKAQHPSTGQAEAMALTEKATFLMEKYAIDKAMLDARNNHDSAPMSADLIVSGTYINALQQLVGQIARAFGAHCVYLDKFNEDTDTRDEIVRIYGYKSDIEMIRMLYTSLNLQCANHVQRIKGRYAGETRLLRRSFIYGFAAEIGARLTEQRTEATVVAEDSNPGAALVLVSRSELAKKKLEADYPRLRKTKISPVDAGAYRRGQTAGANANLHDKSNVGQTRRAALV